MEPTVGRPRTSGDPDDLVDAAEAARMLRYSSRYVIHANRRLGYFPEPDTHAPARRGCAVPLWRRSTVWSAADRRTGPDDGHLPGTSGAPPKPHPYAGDQRLARALAGLQVGEQLTTAGPGRGVGCQSPHRRRGSFARPATSRSSKDSGQNPFGYCQSVPEASQEPMTGPSASRLTLLVLYTPQLGECRDFYAGLGLAFTAEQHGRGPAHYAAVLADGTVLELYPSRPGRQTDILRLGLAIEGGAANPPLDKGRHQLADPDGRVVEVHAK
jgi:hypothetical protein